jgi:hypothetical protein
MHGGVLGICTQVGQLHALIRKQVGWRRQAVHVQGNTHSHWHHQGTDDCHSPFTQRGGGGGGGVVEAHTAGPPMSIILIRGTLKTELRHRDKPREWF